MKIEINVDQVISEARAKIIWGDSPEEVLMFMRTRGIPLEEAQAQMEEFIAERRNELRGRGVKNILFGGVMLAFSAVVLTMMLRAPVRSLYLMGVVGAVGLYGLWLVGKGIGQLCFPQGESGSLADD